AGATRYFEAEHIRACLAPGVPNPFFNQVFLGGPAEHQDLERVFALFDQCSMTPRFEIGPGAISSTLARQLTERRGDGDVAYLADAATIPESRARGAQSALIARRIADASRES